MSAARDIDAICADLLAGKPLEHEVAQQAVRLLYAAADADEERRARGYEAHGARNRAIKAIYQRFYADTAPRPAAEDLEQRMNNYISSGWKRENHRVEIPEHRADSVEGALWALWTEHGSFTLKWRRLYQLMTT